MHILVPGAWTVLKSHKVAEQIEDQIKEKLPQIVVFTHVEPVEDPISLQDIELENE
jgi:divalent metal cation (Fe/Co/Zn/Cd) transporter